MREGGRRTKMEQYYAVVRTGSNDELKHWKYIKKKKVNGKWRYFYDQGEVDKYKNQQKQQYTTKDGTFVTKQYKDSNKLMSLKTSLKTSGSYYTSNGTTGGFSNHEVTYERGKIDRTIDKARAKGEKYIYDNFLNKKNKKKKTKSKKNSIKSSISRGASWIKRKIKTK